MKRILLATMTVAALMVPASAMDRQGGMAAADAEASFPATELTREVVGRIQRTLNDKGYDAGPVDGLWGPQTVAAIENFQHRNNLVVDGQLDDQTIAALGLPRPAPSAARPADAPAAEAAPAPPQPPPALEQSGIPDRGKVSSDESAGRAIPH
jgi:peptidoglycan hydrolase-like protein with peptidoglycan-binding domain